MEANVDARGSLSGREACMRRGINSQEVSNGLLRGWLIIVGHRYTAYNGVFAGCFFQTFSLARQLGIATKLAKVGLLPASCPS